MEHRIFNPTDHVVSWHIEYEQNTYDYIFNPRESLLVRKVFAEQLIKNHPELIDQTVVVNDPDYLNKELNRKTIQRKDIVWNEVKKLSWFHRWFHRNCSV